MTPTTKRATVRMALVGLAAGTAVLVAACSTTPSAPHATTTTTTVPAGPHVTVTPTSGLSAAGTTVTVAGTGFVPSANPTGLYVSFGTGFSPAQLDMAHAFWVNTAPGPGPQAQLAADGSFSVSLTVQGTVNATDCTTTSCSVVTFSAHDGSYAPSWATMTPVTFGA